LPLRHDCIVLPGAAPQSQQRRNRQFNLCIIKTIADGGFRFGRESLRMMRTNPNSEQATLTHQYPQAAR
jgi:hypothetical protein